MSFFVFSCTFGTDPVRLSMTRADNLGDTIPAFGQLAFAFSQPVSSDEISLALNPNPGSVYSTRLNSSHDTLFLDVTGMLQGDTIYTIDLLDTVRAGSGMRLLPGEVQFIVTTGAVEQEPNGTRETADVLTSSICGFIQTTQDADCYMANVRFSHFVLYATDKDCGMRITDSTGLIDTLKMPDTPAETLLVPSAFQFPVLITVYSYYGTSQRRYRLLGIGAQS
jgi:hypothetical protein